MFAVAGNHSAGNATSCLKPNKLFESQQAVAMKMCASRPVHECKELSKLFGIAQPVTPAPIQPLTCTVLLLKDHNVGRYGQLENMSAGIAADQDIVLLMTTGQNRPNDHYTA